jgi:filamentous hemagglutinin family protein
VIDWRSFSINNGYSVAVNNGGIYNATLARVTGVDPSVIDGKLSATSSFYLVNPQGVLIGKNGIVTTGGRFVASTLDTSNDLFMNGIAAPMFSGTSNASVVNLGSISSTGGDVFLISRKLAENDGFISAPQGSVELSTGDQVAIRNQLLLVDPTMPQTAVQATSAGDVVNKGTIAAAQIALQAADGNVFALAGNNSALRASGIETCNGRVWLIADKGTAHVHGDVEATNASGTGGIVNTEGDTLHLDDANVRAALWNVTATQLNVGPVTASILSNNLSNGTSVALNAKRGDIALGSTLRWSGDASLTVNANQSVTVLPGAVIGNTGAGNLTLRADADGATNGSGVVNRGTIDWSKSMGGVASVYDSNGIYTPGTILRNPSWAAVPYSGLKTQVRGYRLVNSLNDLANISNDMQGNYALGKDLDATGQTDVFYSIGSATRTAFTGQFDGMNHLISNLFMRGYETGSPSHDVYAGLFAVIGTAGVVRNVGFESTSASTSASPVGMIAGRNDGLITDAWVASGSVTSDDPFGAVGGGASSE